MNTALSVAIIAASLMLNPSVFFVYSVQALLLSRTMSLRSAQITIHGDHLAGLKLSEFVAPPVYITSIGVIQRGLSTNTEASISGVRSHPSDILPVPPVYAGVVVDEMVLEPIGSEAPIDLKFSGEIARDHLSSSVR